MFVLQSCWTLLCSERFAPYTKVTAGSMSSLGHLMMRGGMQIFECPAGRSDSVAVHQPVISVKTLHSGAQYPWSDANDTVISNLSKHSWYEDTSAQIGFESHFKPPRHLVWIWFSKTGCHVVYCCSGFLKPMRMKSGKSSIWARSLNKALVFHEFYLRSLMKWSLCNYWKLVQTLFSDNSSWDKHFCYHTVWFRMHWSNFSFSSASSAGST